MGGWLVLSACMSHTQIRYAAGDDAVLACFQRCSEGEDAFSCKIACRGTTVTTKSPCQTNEGDRGFVCTEVSKPDYVLTVACVVGVAAVVGLGVAAIVWISHWDIGGSSSSR